ncbi:haloacid dehalogenase-like hydrolase [Nostoc sp. NIES-2111]|nr:haloacid dehalogenase-like hydrolase [Nostoc sp. NIES-2111]
MQLVIFDIDGTLTNSNDFDATCFIRAFELEFGFSEINSNWSEYENITDSGITQQIFWEKLNQLPKQEEVLKIKKRFVSLLENTSQKNKNLCNEIPGAAQVLAEFSKKQDWGIAIAIT